MLTAHRTVCALAVCETAADPSTTALQIAHALWDSSMPPSNSTYRNNYFTHCQQYANAIASIYRYKQLKSSMNSLLGEMTPSSLQAFEKLVYELKSLRGVSENAIEFYIAQQVSDDVISKAFAKSLNEKAVTGGAA
jgi:hypothetical protein